MLLGASGERDGQPYDLSAVNDSNRDSGVRHGSWLVRLTELAITGNWEELGPALTKAGHAMGRRQAVDALVVASAFNGITRVADCTGIPLDENTAVTTGEMRARVGLDVFDYEQKSQRFG